MTIVIDANLLIVTALDRQRAPVVEGHLRAWRASGETLHAPSLLRYEVASALTRAVAAGHLEPDHAYTAWEAITSIPVTLHELRDGSAVIDIARRLNRKSAYDAAYIALAETLNTEVWTLDGPLARNAETVGLPVRLMSADSLPGASELEPRHAERARRLLDRLERRDDYGTLLMKGSVMVSTSEVADPEAWRAGIRRRARADRIKIRTGRRPDAVFALLKRVRNEAEIEQGRRRVRLAFDLHEAALALGHDPVGWVRDGDESASACDSCGALGYVDASLSTPVVAGGLFAMPCTAAHQPRRA